MATNNAGSTRGVLVRLFPRTLKGTTRSQNPNPEEKYKADNMIERLKLLQLEADQMVKERKDRSLEENKVAESIKRMAPNVKSSYSPVQ